MVSCTQRRVKVIISHLSNDPATHVLSESLISHSDVVHNRRAVVTRLPEGVPKPSDFEIKTETLPPLMDGQLLLKTKWLTVDPYMNTIEGMRNPKQLGKTMIGGSVSEVLESKATGWEKGDLLVGYYGWQEYCIGTPSKDTQFHGAIPVQKWNESLGPPSLALGVLGMTGYTAFFGLLEVGKPQAGETVVVSDASGAVGQIVGQLAKIQGCRVVGIAGGPKKCAHCVDELGFDACIDYKAQDFRNSLAAATPMGVDVYFENVGGDVLEAVIPLLNKDCRVPICGFVSQYSSGNPQVPMHRLKEAGFKAMRPGASTGYRFFFWSHPDFLPKLDEALNKLSNWVKEGHLKYSESVTEGFDNIVDAFVGMLKGENLGKAMVKVS